MKYLIPILFVLYSCVPASEPSISVSDEAVVFEGVNIIDVRDGNVIEDQLVVVDSGKIVSITGISEQQNTSWPESVTVIDASGKFITPGLAEMHAHIPSPGEGEDWIEDVLFLYLAQGVTTIRGMLGHPRHLELREAAAQNTILSPRIYTSSTSFNGNSVPTPDAGRQKVIESKEAGYDFLKFHPGIKMEVHDEIIRTAKEVGIPYAGHVSTDVGIRHALESEYATIDHVDGYLEGLVPKPADVSPDENGFFGYNFTDLADRSIDRKSTRLNSSHVRISYAVFCLKKKTQTSSSLCPLSLLPPPFSLGPAATRHLHSFPTRRSSDLSVSGMLCKANMQRSTTSMVIWKVWFQNRLMYLRMKMDFLVIISPIWRTAL